MNIVLTGPTGNLGKALLEYNKTKHRVFCCCYDELIPESDSVESRLIDSGSFIKSITDFKPSIFIHTAAVYGRNGELDKLIETNIMFSVKMFELAKELNADKFIYFNTALAENVSSYALSKHQASQWGVRILKEKFVNISLQQFYGKECNTSNLITSMIIRCIKGETIDLTTGLQKRDLVNLDDICKAVDIISISSQKFPSCIELGSGNAVPFKDIMCFINDRCGNRAKLNFGAIPLRENEPDICVADISLLNQLGWTPKIELYNGIDNTIKKIKEESGIL